jgi:predicted nicotinamide N-methyase
MIFCRIILVLTIPFYHQVVFSFLHGCYGVNRKTFVPTLDVSVPFPCRLLLKSTKRKDDSSSREEQTIHLSHCGTETTLISRNVPITKNLTITVYEMKEPAEEVNAYWDVITTTIRDSNILDPFGIVTWPGSVKAAQELVEKAKSAVKDKTVVVLGAGVGVESQTAAILGASKVIATDIHPTTIQQLEYGVAQEPRILPGIVETQILDLFASSTEQPIPMPCDLLVVADVLYNEELVNQVCRRCAEALNNNPSIRILITDSQRFVPSFLDKLNDALQSTVAGSRKLYWTIETMKAFSGSGVIINDDQIYDVKVQHLWIGL